MYSRSTTLLTLILVLYSCGTQKDPEPASLVPVHVGSPYHENVGDIPFDPESDDPDFILCEQRILQYYNFGKAIMYKGERPALIDHIHNSYQKTHEVNGYVTVRFVVNCNGETDRFRSSSMDDEYEKQDGQEGLEKHFLEIMKSADGWLSADYDGATYPYYQYLTFRLEKGEITRIIP